MSPESLIISPLKISAKEGSWEDSAIHSVPLLGGDRGGFSLVMRRVHTPNIR